MSPCLTNSQVLLFVDAQLPADEIDEIEAHLSGCPICRQVVAGVVRNTPIDGVPAHSPSLASSGIAEVPWTHFVRGRNIADRYLILDELGAGAFGVVYSAFDQKLDRKLALKFLRGGAHDQTENGQSRLLREGQSLARLSHPNVVAIYDVGTFDRYNYIAMELIDGRSLRQWLVEEQPSWRQILTVYLEAARGLMAAHDVGLVHRDFKPDNVLIARDGRVRVSDFGFSHMLSEAADPLTDAERAAPHFDSLAQPSTIAGTPAYMAPEQYRGELIDSRADQFSFCASLYEALYKVRPFAGSTPAALMQAVCEGKVRTPPRSLRLPSFLHAAVLRGLRPLPQERFASMAPLYDVLNRGPQRRRMQLGVGFSVALVLATSASAWQLRTKPCQGAAAQLDGVWSEVQKQAVMQAFEKTALPFAATAWQRLRQQLDTYADRWVGARTEACQAANVRHEISPALLDKRTGCLDQRLYELRATVALLAKADAAVVERANQLGSNLRSVDDCSSAAVLSARVAPPPPNQAAQVSKLRQRLTEISLQEQVGRYEQALVQARVVANEAAALGYQPVRAEAGLLLSTLEERTGDTEHAAETLRAALTEAEASQDYKTVLAAWLQLTRFSILSKMDFKLAADYFKHAEAFMAHAGTERERAVLFELEAKLVDKKGLFREAKQAVEKGLASTIAAYGPDSPQAAVYRSRLGIFQVNLGESERGLQNLAQALALAERVLGPDHPDLIMIHGSYGLALQMEFRYDEALAELRQDLRIVDQIYPPIHVRRQIAILAILSALIGGGYYAEGERQAQRWLTLDEQATDHVPELIINAYQVMALAQQGQGRRGAAMQTIKQAMGRLAEFSEEGSLRGELLAQLADCEREEGQLSAALLHYQQSLAIEEKIIPDRPEFVLTLTGIGKLYLARGETGTAIPYLERALRKGQGIREDMPLRNGPYFALAQALISTDGDRVRARQLAEQARDIWQKCGGPCRTDLAKVSAWLQKHSPEGH